tara:strand:- start:1409 stop:1618 length:210 start_codon:yes stop_codon:yes gene_type:complete
MFNQDELLEYLSSPAGINKIILGIIMIASINAILIFYSVRKTYVATIQENERRKNQQQKLDKLAPKNDQ